MVRSVIVITMLLFALSYPSIIKLNDGTIINGIIQSESNNKIIIVSNIGEITIDRSKISNIQYSEPTTVDPVAYKLKDTITIQQKNNTDKNMHFLLS